jgi:DNA invertase Pin-like site-specific DNA recombinase
MNSKIIITLFSLFGELERDLVSLRTKEALAAKKSQGIKLGKPKGTIQKSKFDKDVERIKELLDIGLSVRKMALLQLIVVITKTRIVRKIISIKQGCYANTITGKCFMN